MSSLDFAGWEIVLSDLRAPSVPGWLAPLALTPGNGFVVTSFVPGFPSVRDSVATRADDDGTDDTTAYIGARAISLQVGLVPERAGVTNRALAERFLAFCQPSLRCEIRWRAHPLDPFRRFVVRSAGAPWNVPTDGPEFASVDSSWVAPSGVAEAAAETVVTIVAGVATDAPGRAYDLAFNRAYPAFTGVGATPVVNDGLLPVHWVATIFGPLTNPVLRCDTTGDELRFTARGGVALDATQALIINSQNRTATVGASNVYGAIAFPESRWFKAPPGPQSWRLVSATGSGTASAELRFRPAWL